MPGDKASQNERQGRHGRRGTWTTRRSALCGAFQVKENKPDGKSETQDRQRRVTNTLLGLE